MYSVRVSLNVLLLLEAPSDLTIKHKNESNISRLTLMLGIHRLEGGVQGNFGYEHIYFLGLT